MITPKPKFGIRDKVRVIRHPGWDDDDEIIFSLDADGWTAEIASLYLHDDPRGLEWTYHLKGYWLQGYGFKESELEPVK